MTQTFKRIGFTAVTKRQAYGRSQGICECHLIPWLNRPKGCGILLGIGNTYFEHIRPLNLGGDSSFTNAACLCKTCWSEKTATYDLKVIAKSNRVRDKARGIRNPTTFRGWRRFDGSPVYANRRGHD